MLLVCAGSLGFCLSFAFSMPFSLIMLKSMCHRAPAREGMNLSLHLSGLTGDNPLALGEGGSDRGKCRFAKGEEDG